MIPQRFLVFGLASPPPPRTQVPFFWVWGQNFFAYCGRRVYLDLGPDDLFSCTWILSPMAGVPSQLRVAPVPPPPPLWPLASEDLAVFTPGGLFSGTQKPFQNHLEERLLDQAQARASHPTF